MFTTAGYQSTSIEAILSASKVSRGAFYHHFKSKEQIFEAVFLLGEQEITRRLIEETKHISEPVERLGAGCRRFIEVASQKRFRQIGLIDAPVVLGWRRWRDLEEQYGLGVLRAGLNAVAIARGRPTAFPHESARLLLAALIEAAMIVARSKDRRKTLAGCASVVDKLLAAFLER